MLSETPVAAAWVVAQSTGTRLPEITRGQFWTGVVATIALVLGLLYIWYRTRYAGLPPENESNKDRLWSQLYHNEPSTLRIPAGEDVGAYASDLLELVSDPAQRGVDKRKATVSGALSDARASAAQTYAPILETLPTSAVRTIELGVLVAILGAPAVSTAAILELLESDGVNLSLVDVLTILVDATVSVGTLGLEALTTFPHTGMLFALGMTVVMVGGEWLFDHWYVTTAVLVGGAIAIIALDYLREQHLETPLYEDRRNLGVAILKRVGVVWVSGVVPALLGTGAGVDAVGAFVGVVFAALVALYFLADAVISAVARVAAVARLSLSRRRSTVEPLEMGDSSGGRVRATLSALFRRIPWVRGSSDSDSDDVDPALEAGLVTGLEYDPFEAALNLEAQLDDTAHDWRGPSPDWGLAGYLFVRRLIVAAWVLVAPLPLAYAASGVSSGAYADVLRALVGATPAVKILVAACVLAPVAVFAYLGRGSADDFVTGLRETWSRRRVRMAAFRRGVPIMAVIAACVITYSITRVPSIAVVVAVVVGLVARLVYEALMATKYRISMFEDRGPVEKSVLVEAYVLEDASGTERYYASLDGKTTILTDTPEAFVDAIEAVHPDVARRETPTPTVPVWRARFALEFGIVDADVTESKLREKVRKRAVRELRGDKWAYLSTLEDQTGELPREKLDSWLRWGERHGVVSIREDTTGDDVVFLKRDPWEKRGRSS